MKNITNEIRLNIFGQYPLQPILICEPNIQKVSHYLEGVDYSNGTVIAERVRWNPEWIRMHLKSLDLISDEDAIGLADLMSEFQLSGYSNEHKINWIKKFIQNEPIKDYSRKFSFSIEVYQFLQSKGYALPFMNYSVTDLIEAGIYELIK